MDYNFDGVFFISLWSFMLICFKCNIYKVNVLFDMYNGYIIEELFKYFFLCWEFGILISCICSYFINCLLDYECRYGGIVKRFELNVMSLKL